MSDSLPPRARVALTAGLLLIVIAGAVDLILDAPARWLSAHVVYEVVLLFGLVATVAWLWLGWWRSGREVARLERSVAERLAERDAWRREAERALAGFGEAIDARFAAWRLTPAEREVALGLLKGKSHKQIAAATNRSERTVRQHAIAVYQKSGLDGRAELAAFFLEDVKLPEQVQPSP